MRRYQPAVSLCTLAIIASFAVHPDFGLSSAQEVSKPTLNVTYDIVYSKPEEDLELKLDAYIPDGEGPFPAVLVVHGGAWRTGSKIQLASHARKFAERGMAAFAINYRLAPKHKFPAQIHDCKAAIRWMRRHADEYHVDSRRIGAYGYSAGGHLVALLGVTRASDGLEGDTNGDRIDTQIQCVCAGGAPCDFQEIAGDSMRLAFWLGGTRNELPSLYRSASPIAFVRSDNPPMFFFHGSQDELVKIRDVERMVESLKEDGVRAELYVVDGASHIAAALNQQAINRAADFLLEHLKKVGEP